MSAPTVEHAGASETQRRIPELDGLRGIAIGLVLVWHYFVAPVRTTPATFLSYVQAMLGLTWSGVDLFFVLSGFLIGGILLDARDSANYFKVFYVRRSFRILPIYIVLLIGFVGLRAAVGAAPGTRFASTLGESMPLFSYVFFVQNFWMAAAGTFGCGWLASTWSLAVEEQFYLTLPSMVRFFSRRILVVFVSFGIAIAPVVRVLFFQSSQKGWMASYVLLFCRADALLIGVFCVLVLKNPAWRARVTAPAYLLPVAVLILLGAVGICLRLRAGLASLSMASFGYTALAALYGCILLLVCTRPDNLAAIICRWPVLRWLGSIAYGTYLFHMPIRDIVFGLVYGTQSQVLTLSFMVLTFFALLLTLGLAQLSWSLFEKPLVRFSHRIQYELSSGQQGMLEKPLAAGAQR